MDKNSNNNIMDEDEWTLVGTNAKTNENDANVNADHASTSALAIVVSEEADTESSAITSSQELNSAVLEDAVSENVPFLLDESYLLQLFPTKDESKRQIWLSTLHQNEFETLKDLDSLDNDGWNTLSLPLAVKAVLKAEAKKRPSETKTFFDRCDIDRSAELLPNKVVRPVRQVDCIVMDISSSMRARSRVDIDKTREDGKYQE